MGKVGAKLKTAREKKGLSLEEVYQKTRIHPRVLEAMEEDRSDPFLSRTHVKGFLKSYAALLGLKAEGIVQEYLQGVTSKAALPDIASTLEPLSEIEVEGELGVSPWAKKALLGIAAIGCVALLVLGFSKLKSFGRDFFQESPLSAETAFQRFDRRFQIPEGEPLQLKVSARENAWIVLKSDDRLVYQGLLAAGHQESWSAQRDFALSLGDGGSVVLELNRRRLGVPGEKGRPVEGLRITREGIAVEKIR